MPAMRAAAGEDPGKVTVQLVSDEHAASEEVEIASESDAGVSVSGPPVQVLLALWGRPHGNVEVSDGDPAVWSAWQQLPSKAFQWGTWD